MVVEKATILHIYNITQASGRQARDFAMERTS